MADSVETIVKNSLSEPTPADKIAPGHSDTEAMAINQDQSIMVEYPNIVHGQVTGSTPVNSTAPAEIGNVAVIEVRKTIKHLPPSHVSLLHLDLQSCCLCDGLNSRPLQSFA